MSDQRKKPGWTFWIAAGALSLVAYPLSAGPVWWLGHRGMISEAVGDLIDDVYYPLDLAIFYIDPYTNAYNWQLWYLHLWAP